MFFMILRAMERGQSKRQVEHEFFQQISSFLEQMVELEQQADPALHSLLGVLLNQARSCPGVTTHNRSSTTPPQALLPQRTHRGSLKADNTMSEDEFCHFAHPLLLSSKKKKNPKEEAGFKTLD